MMPQDIDVPRTGTVCFHLQVIARILNARILISIPAYWVDMAKNIARKCDYRISPSQELPGTKHEEVERRSNYMIV